MSKAVKFKTETESMPQEVAEKKEGLKYSLGNTDDHNAGPYSVTNQRDT